MRSFQIPMLLSWTVTNMTVAIASNGSSIVMVKPIEFKQEEMGEEEKKKKKKKRKKKNP